ncbi:TVP38/TMEM64 family protein [Haloarchaeobius sp. HRN-SO-5]|uniref:TVP38/TMEM64 family protein n=1 Tax=Haloarchaeobius sp. HRN-SO-5 TaxID=3446118 RepID=UPI003EB8A164
MRRRHRQRAVAVAVISFLVVARTTVGGDVPRLVAAVENDVLFVAILLVGYVVRPFLAVPVTAFTLLVGYRFGWVGLPVALVGGVVTSVPAYVVGRRYKSDTGLLGWVRQSGREVFDATGDLRGTVAGRLSPAPADAVAYGTGLADVPLGAFLLGTFVGELPWILTFVAIGVSARDVTAGESLNPLVLVGAAVLALALVARPLYRRYDAHRSA